MGETKHIVIIAISDTHGNIIGYDYGKKDRCKGGLARFYTYVNKVRKENRNVILLDCGDTIQGNVMTDEVCAVNPFRRHPVIQVMNRLKYDAMTLGNHDFDFGVPVQRAVLGHAKFPVLAANVRNKDNSLFTGKGYVIVERDGVKIAVIGVVTPFVPVLSGSVKGIEELTFVSGNEAVREAIDEIGDRADVFVVSAHMGCFGEYDSENESDSALHIAKCNSEVTVLQSAHTHITESGKCNNAVYAQVRDNAVEALRFDLYFDGKKVTDVSSRVINLDDYEPSWKICNLPSVVHAHKKAVYYTLHGKKNEDSSAEIGEASGTFQPEDKSVVRFEETPLVRFVNHIQMEAAEADVSVYSLAELNCDIVKGRITGDDIDRIYPFPNFLVRVKITGAELKAVMEYSAGCYAVASDGTLSVLPEDEFPVFMQDFFSGVDYEIHVKNPKGSRIRNIRFKGEVLEDSQELTLAVNNYRFNTVYRREKLIGREKEWSSEITVADIIKRYITENSPVSPVLDGNWKIVL